MKRFILATLTAVIMVALVCVSATISASKDRDVSGDAPRITMEELKSMLGDPNLVIIDSLVGDQWETVAQKLPGRCMKTRTMSIPGLINTPKTKPLSPTVPDPLNPPVPGWHVN